MEIWLKTEKGMLLNTEKKKYCQLLQKYCQVLKGKIANTGSAICTWQTVANPLILASAQILKYDLLCAFNVNH